MWIFKQKNSDGTSRYECSSCQDTMNLSPYTFETFHFCPKCGAPQNGYGFRITRPGRRKDEYGVKIDKL